MTTPITMTKSEIREHIATTIKRNRAAGVPEDGIADILAEWVAAHLRQQSVVTDTPRASTGASTLGNSRALLKALTGPRIAELKRLTRGNQHTFGAHRARVQHWLVNAGLARFLDEQGVQTVADFSESCEITGAGRLLLDAFLKGDAHRRGTTL